MNTSFVVDLKTTRLLSGLIAWRAAFALLSGAGLVFLWSGSSPLKALWQIILLTVVILPAMALSVLSARDIARRDHRGRTISLALDYLGFVACVVLALTLGEVFTGIDALADTFARGLPYLGVALAGYLLDALVDGFFKEGGGRNRAHQLARWVMLGGFGFFLWQVGAAQGLMYFLARLAQPAGIAAAAGLFVFALALWAMWRQPTAAAMNVKTSHEQMLSGWLFLSPNLIGFLIFFAGPLLLSFYFSFTDSDAINTPNWVGLENYAKIFNIRLVSLESPTQLARDIVDIRVYDEVGRLKFGQGGVLFAAEDRLFWFALRNTLTFVLFAVPLSVLPALFLANILNGKLPGMKFFRAVYFMPSIAAVVGISLVWQWLYNATIGYINYFITSGITLWNSVFQAGLIDPKIQWVSDEKTALMAVILIAAWQTMGFNTVLFLAGLQNVPGELYEAATVDGAGAWSKFWAITIPMLAPSTFYVITTTTIQAMQVFEQVFILMNPPEGPNNATLTLVYYLYRSGFNNFKQGYASALAWVLFIVIFGLTLVQFQRQRRSSIYEG
jgi:ABC-type sugar transport system permease subunit